MCQFLNVGIDRDVVFGEAGIHDSPEPLVEHCFLCECHADAHNDAALKLRVRRFWVENSSGIERAHEA